MRQTETPDAHSSGPGSHVLHWLETCTPATSWSRPTITGTINTDDYTSKWTAVITRSLHARAAAQHRAMQPSQLKNYNRRIIRDTMIAVGAQAVIDITSITHPEADDDMDVVTA